MKEMKIYLIVWTFCLSLLPMQAQNTKVESFFKNVLVQNSRIWQGNSSPDSMKHQLLEFYQTICTQRLFKELVDEQNQNGLDHDLITSDYGFDEYSLKTMYVSKYSSNTYRVTYQVFMPDVKGKQKKYDVILYYQIKVINNKFKINSVSILLEDGTICRIV